MWTDCSILGLPPPVLVFNWKPVLLRNFYCTPLKIWKNITNQGKGADQEHCDKDDDQGP